MIGVDPDGTHTAVCLLGADGSLEFRGGGQRRDGEPLCSVTGALAVLREHQDGLIAGVYVEDQIARSVWTEAVEGCRRSRYMWEAACELTASPYSCFRVSRWARYWVGKKAAQNRSSRISACRAKARLIGDQTGVLAANLDQYDALGIAAYGAHQLGWSADIAWLQPTT